MPCRRNPFNNQVCFVPVMSVGAGFLTAGRNPFNNQVCFVQAVKATFFERVIAKSQSLQ